MTNTRGNASQAWDLEFNLTGTLSHEEVETLARMWTPEIRFHEKERFHPIDLERYFKVPVKVLQSLPPAAQEAFLIKVTTALGDQLFKPPIVRRGSTVLIHGGEIEGDLEVDADGTEILLDPAINDDTVYSHGGSLSRSTEFFGASDTVSGNPEPQPGDPRVPRHDIVVRAEMRFLLDVLRHALTEPHPTDSIWGWFEVFDYLILENQSSGDQWTNRLEKMSILRDLVTAYKAEDAAGQTAALQRIAAHPGWVLNQRAWDAIRFYAFLEFYFLYAYNDYPDYGDWPFTNEHEGDVEGCCVVFDRRDLVAKPLDQVVAHTVITSVHEEFNDNDELKRLPVDRDGARDDLVVYVAPGSHATYLTPGTHDVIDWEDILTDWDGEITSGWKELLVGLLYPLVFVALLLAAFVEHFVDAEDETTDDGVWTGPPGVTPPGGKNFRHELIVTPLSHIRSEKNIYQGGLTPPQNGQQPAELARRAYWGMLGAHAGTANHSAAWEVKTKRYFLKFLESGEITGDIIL